MKTIYKLRLKFNLWYREKQTNDAYIDMIDAKIWWLTELSGGSNNGKG